MKHYHLCADGWKRTGRYIIGILIFANGFAGWFAAHPNATACEVVITMALLIMATGLATFVAYGIDNTVDRERRGQDLRERGTPVEG